MILYRYAGDEFIVLSMYDYSDTEDVMKKILLDMNKDMIYNHCVFTLGFSYGIVEFDKENCNMTKLIKIADAKMYECKKLRKVNR